LFLALRKSRKVHADYKVASIVCLHDSWWSLAYSIQVAPIYKQMAEQYKDKAVFAKVDINANYQTASSQQIRHVPALAIRTTRHLCDAIAVGCDSMSRFRLQAVKNLSTPADLLLYVALEQQSVARVQNRCKCGIGDCWHWLGQCRIRSMPTFQLYLFGKKRDQFSGADVQRIQNMMGQVWGWGWGWLCV